jgi:putative ABC transport system permease protein
MRKVAVIGSTVAQNLFPSRPGRVAAPDPQRAFDIVGVLATKGQNAGGQDQDDVVIIPYTTAQARLSGSTRIFQILVSATSQQDLPAAQQEVTAIMHESHKIGDADDDFTVRNQTEIANAAGNHEDHDVVAGLDRVGVADRRRHHGIMNIMLCR